MPKIQVQKSLGLGALLSLADKRVGACSVRSILLCGALALAPSICTAPAHASSHREAPGITGLPKLDATDFYMFRSYEPGRAGFVTFVANYIPGEDPFLGPNYFELDPKGIYEIKIDNNGDGVEDITFQFQFTNTRQDLSVNVGGVQTAVPLLQLGQVGRNGNPR